jgi:hypothetical protein
MSDTTTPPPITSMRPMSWKRRKPNTTSGRIMVDRASPKPKSTPAISAVSSSAAGLTEVTRCPSRVSVGMTVDAMISFR